MATSASGKLQVYWKLGTWTTPLDHCGAAAFVYWTVETGNWKQTAQDGARTFGRLVPNLWKLSVV